MNSYHRKYDCRFISGNPRAVLRLVNWLTTMCRPGRHPYTVGAQSLGRSPASMYRLRIKLQVIITREAMDLLTKVMLPGMPLVGGGNVRSRSVSTAGASGILLLSALAMQCFGGTTN